jgi:hypothetical protein
MKEHVYFSTLYPFLTSISMLEIKQLLMIVTLRANRKNRSAVGVLLE